MTNLLHTKLLPSGLGSSNPLVVTGICDPNKSRARHYRMFNSAFGTTQNLCYGFYKERSDLFVFVFIENVHLFKCTMSRVF